MAGVTYVYHSPSWGVKAQTSPNVVLSVSDTPPSSPTPGMLWWESDSGSLFIWYNDGSSSQWVQVNVPSDFTLGTQFVAKTGDTMTGNLTLAAAIPELFINKAASGQAGRITAQTNGLNRWRLQFADNNPEAGSNAGSDFLVSRYNDAGTFLDNPFGIQRSTGLVLLNRGQLYFPPTANPSTDVYTLDDYREGTWVPTIGGTATYTQQVGRYQKVGNKVHIEGILAINAIGTGDVMNISGLPFTINGPNAVVSVGYWTAFNKAIVWVGGLFASGTTIMNFYYQTAAATGVVNTSLFGAGTGIQFSGSYTTSS